MDIIAGLYFVIENSCYRKKISQIFLNILIFYISPFVNIISQIKFLGSLTVPRTVY